MPISKLPAADVQMLNGIADTLMTLGRDLAADRIYAILEDEEAAVGDCTTGEWSEVFGN